MAQNVRVGLVSTSWWAEEMFLPSLQSFYDGYKAQQVIDAALTSHATGRAVAISGQVVGRVNVGWR